MSRASSVKVTKYDHRHNNNIPITNQEEEDDDLEEVITVKRAVSVKKSTSSRSSSVTRVDSLNSEDVKMAKPKMVRINTIIRKESNGVTRKRSMRTIIDQDQIHVPSNDPPEPNQTDQIDFYFCPPEQETMSIQSSNSTSTSTLGDGEITVYWGPGQHPP